MNEPSDRQLELLAYIQAHPGCGLRDAAQAFGVRPETIEHHLHRLELANLARRLRVAAGGRIIIYSASVDVDENHLAMAKLGEAVLIVYAIGQAERPLTPLEIGAAVGIMDLNHVRRLVQRAVQLGFVRQEGRAFVPGRLRAA